MKGKKLSWFKDQNHVQAVIMYYRTEYRMEHQQGEIPANDQGFIQNQGLCPRDKHQYGDIPL